MAELSSGIGLIIVIINRVYSALVVVIGTIGNVYCLYVIRSTTLRKFSSSQYLLALACSDLGFLLSLSVIWLSGAGVRLYHLNGLCQLTNYASYVCCFLSAWYIVALTAERCIVVYRPFYARTVASPKRARAVICVITIIGLAVNSFILLLVESQPMEDDQLKYGDHVIIEMNKNISQPINHTDQLALGADCNEIAINRTRKTCVSRDFKNTQSERIDETSIQFRRIHRHLDHSASADWILRGTAKNSTTKIHSNPHQLYFCTEKADTTNLYHIFNTIDMIFSFSIPLFLIFMFNIFICVRLLRTSRERKTILASASAGGSSKYSAFVETNLATLSPNCISQIDENSTRIRAVSDKLRGFSVESNDSNHDDPETRNNNVRKKLLISGFTKNFHSRRVNSSPASHDSLEKEKHVTLFLVSISLTNLILNLPSYLFRLIQTLTASPAPRSDGSNSTGDAESIVISILYLLFYTQFAINFILYSCQSRKIRGRLR